MNEYVFKCKLRFLDFWFEDRIYSDTLENALLQFRRDYPNGIESFKVVSVSNLW